MKFPPMKISKVLENILSNINKAFNEEPEVLKELGIDDNLIMALEEVIKKSKENEKQNNNSKEDILQ